MKKYFALIIGLIFSGVLPQWAQAQGKSFTTITSVRVNALSNGVQLSITADGILQYRNPDTNGLKMAINFPDARNGTGKNFFNVNRYPVSHIQLATPQGAQGGIGLVMNIQNFVPTNATVTQTPNGQGILLTIQSDRTIVGKANPAAAAGNPPNVQAASAVDTSTEVLFANNRLALRAVRADIHELMAGIAQKTGLSIAIDDAVDRKVSLNLRDVAPDVAVQSIATAYGLALSYIDGIYMMSEGVPTDLATYHLSGTESYRMQNTQAQTVSGLLPNFLYAYVKVNSEQNAVVVTAPSQMLAKIGADLQKVDTPSPQILIEAIAVELTDTTDRDLGLTIGSNDAGSFGFINGPAGVISYNTIGKLPRLFEANLRALELKGKARVRARPQMAVVNGRTANIFIGAQRFIQTFFNSSGQTQVRIQPVDVGVKLLITPLTGGNNEITTRIAPEVSNITELDLQTGLPVLSTRRADTTVRVKDGETIAIGGLSLNQQQVTNRKIPVLGDIPLLGSLFRSRKQNEVRTELVVFVTPRILTGESILNVPAGTTTPTVVAPAAP
jgi:type IV pilus assembly protein PilQ